MADPERERLAQVVSRAMQTFVPFPDFAETASVLDRARLGNQRLEARTIHTTLTTGRGAWSHHPAVKMWAGHEAALLDYGLAICDEWIRRGYVDQQRKWFLERGATGTAPLPPWVGREDVHRSHQSNLIRKDAEWYGPCFPGVPADLPYVWPTGALP